MLLTITAGSMATNLCAFHALPYFPQPLQPIAEVGYDFEYFKRVEGLFDDHFPEHGHTANLGLLFAPNLDWCLEATLRLTDTNRHHFFFNDVEFAARYLFLDDVIGDPLSLCGGIAATISSRKSLDDFLTEHLSQVDIDLFAAAGHEQAIGARWFERTLLMGGITIPIRGSPLFWFEAALHFNDRDRYVFGLWIGGAVGLGGHNLSTPGDFKGYGPIKTRSAETGLFIERSLSLFGSLIFEYSIRLFAHNLPQYAQCFSLTLLVPISL